MNEVGELVAKYNHLLYEKGALEKVSWHAKLKMATYFTLHFYYSYFVT